MLAVSAVLAPVCPCHPGRLVKGGLEPLSFNRLPAAAAAAGRPGIR